ncbi:sodium:calcium antiporter [Pseudonocardia bannensis]|uniref:Sodium:proton exchanger n=1 Tax=Pseudonocardia bannensis TaxID=630973 RepID=A0A848DI28_9PSEU|nr:sodium:proton exchanger [Pseudonocardia bannensis]NMH92216.1 sodium:proton exchanger [Pseudonocardia bannensis]
MASILIFVAGAALLIYSAEKLIVYLVGAARGLAVSLLLLAVVFTGIEFDDLVFGMALNLEGLGDVAIGTVMGTVIAMTGLVLALAAIISPATVHVPRDYLAIFALSPLVLVGAVLLSPLTRLYGTVLLGLFVLFVAYIAVREARGGAPFFRNAEIYETVGDAVDKEKARIRKARGTVTDEISFTEKMAVTSARPRSGWVILGLAVLALAGLIIGAAVMSEGTGRIIEEFGIEGTLFGATLATLVLSIEDIVLTSEPFRKGAPQIGVGNVIGSVVFSVTGKLGIILLAGGAILVDDKVLTWHVPALFVLTAFSAFALYTGRLKRWHGIVLLVAYVAYFVVSFTAFGGVEVDAD